LYTEPQPDIVLLKPRKDYYEGKKMSWEDALLVIEVADTTMRRDRNLKLPLYAKAGVPELWIEDLRRNTIFVYRDPLSEAYSTALTLRRGAAIAPLAFPEIVFKVEDLIG
jgi:Uma2 family endonuclease